MIRPVIPAIARRMPIPCRSKTVRAAVMPSPTALKNPEISPTLSLTHWAAPQVKYDHTLMAQKARYSPMAISAEEPATPKRFQKLSLA